MAGLFGTIANSAAIGMAGSGTKKTHLQISAPAGAGLRVKGIEITGSGISTTQAKVLCEVEKAAGAGAGGTAVTPVKKQGHTGTIQATAKEGLSTVSTGDVIAKAMVHQQWGYQFGEEIILAPSERLSVNLTGVDANATGMVVRAQIEE